MTDLLTIGKFEFITAPGRLIKRKRRRSWYPAILPVGMTMLMLINGNYSHGWYWAAIAVIMLSPVITDTPENREAVPLMEQRDSRWIVCGHDAGPITGSQVFVKQDGDRWRILIDAANNAAPPVLIWWSDKRADAYKLRELIDTVPPCQEGEVVWPPTPSSENEN